MIYRTVEQLRKAVELQMQEAMMDDRDRLEDFLADIVQTAIIEKVYDAYEPQKYERRLDNGGLGDTDNIRITRVEFADGGVMVTMENLTTGADNMSGQYISSLIEYGAMSNQALGSWSNSGGAWAEPRPFMQEAMNQLRGASNAELRHIVKQIFQGIGWKFK